MVEQSQTVENNVAKEREDNKEDNKKDNKKDRIKATFSILNHAVKIYNNTETYIKRGLTLFGLGTVIAGAAFNVGQRLPNNQTALPESSSNTPTAEVDNTSTPQEPASLFPQSNPSQPQIIYLKPLPSQSVTIPHSEPSVTPPPAAQQPPQPVATPPATQQPPQPVATPPATQQPPQPTVASTPSDSLPVSEELSQVKQTVESVEKISDKVVNIKQDIIPLFGGEWDD
ncbi:MAG: hypothetical protein QNJ72_25965 [Pleurocapsa sp. MO_226.B13]|nr:hypothetical protein [Pleurocapsa sp. MO_226.B13]